MQILQMGQWHTPDAAFDSGTEIEGTGICGI